MGSATAIGAQPSPDFGPWQMAVDQLHLWGEAVYRFLQWERERILKRDPSPKEQSEHREALRWLLRGSKLLLVMVSDPEFPDRPNVKALEAQIWQLENSWQMIYEPMPEAEADKLLAELFPDASGA